MLCLLSSQAAQQDPRPPRTVNVVGDDPVGLEAGIQLVSHAMDDDGVQPDTVEEVEREGERLEVVGEDGAADLEDGKVGRGREDLEVARDFAARGERVQQSDDRLLRAYARVSASTAVAPSRRSTLAESTGGLSAGRGAGTDPVCICAVGGGVPKPPLHSNVAKLVTRALLLLFDAALRLEEERGWGDGRGREGPAGLCGLVAECTAELCALPRCGCEHPGRVRA